MVPERGETQIDGTLIAETSFGYRSLRGLVPDFGQYPVVPEKGRLLTTCRLPMPADFLTALERQRYQTLRNFTVEQTNIITFHLGNGCSAAAIKNGHPIDTSMGMTPLEGLVMGTRSGDLDPAAVTFIASKEGLSMHEVEGMLNTQSGLLGISGLTNDMRVLQEELRLNDDRRVRLAIDVFCYRARKYAGAYLAAMGGADAIVFTGGIGENSPEIRAQICQGLEWAGLKLDTVKNKTQVGTEGEITVESATLKAYVIPTDEELLIARDTVRVAHASQLR